MDKADFVGSWTVSAGIVQALLAAANNRGQQAFNLLAPYGDTTTTPPLTTAQMAQTYTLDAAAVEVVVQGLAIRGHEFLTALATLATPGGGAGNPSIQETNPNVYRATGTWQGGTVITFNLAIIFVVTGFNLVGDGLRDALDPRLRRIGG